MGSTIKTSQSVTPFQCGTGLARKLNLWPTTGWKSFFISHCSISGPWVKARQTFSGGCGISRSTTMERVAAAGFVIGPSFSTGIRGDRTVFARRRHRGSSSRSRGRGLAARRCSGRNVLQADREPGRRASARPQRSSPRRELPVIAAPGLSAPPRSAHRWVLHAGAIGQGAHGLLAVADQALEDCPTGRVGEGLEKSGRRGLHAGIITLRL